MVLATVGDRLPVFGQSPAVKRLSYREGEGGATTSIGLADGSATGASGGAHGPSLGGGMSQLWFGPAGSSLETILCSKLARC